MRFAKALTAAAFLIGGGCHAPRGPVADDEAQAGLERASYAAAANGSTRISYLRGGTAVARRVIFIHGTPGGASGWADYLLHVPPGFDYIAIDRPGFGQTVPNGAEPSLERQALAIAPLLVRRAGAYPILVGHSLGGPIAARVAADNPGRVAGLLILAGSFDPALEKVHPMQPVGEWIGIRSVLPRHLRNANRELMPLKGELERLAPLLPAIHLPVMILHGTADTLVPVANVAFMKARFTGATSFEVVLLLDQNHFLPWEHRLAVERAISALAAQ